jgi:hypothetical protein
MDGDRAWEVDPDGEVEKRQVADQEECAIGYIGQHPHASGFRIFPGPASNPTAECAPRDISSVKIPAISNEITALSIRPNATPVLRIL